MSTQEITSSKINTPSGRFSISGLWLPSRWGLKSAQVGVREHRLRRNLNAGRDVIRPRQPIIKKWRE
jgi:hypothetical protein